MKYKAGGNEWKHATLSIVTADHQSPLGVVITTPADGKGVYIRRGENRADVYSARVYR